MIKVNWIGSRYGRLVVLERVARPQRGTFFLCRCDCGVEKVFKGENLRTGATASCGCLRRELLTQTNTTHSGTGTRLHSIWMSMKSRCSNPKTQFYYRYGGRGIKVCQEWRQSFEAFEAWAIGHGYLPGLLLERKDNDAGYSPENCCWANQITQSRNMSRNVLVTLRGQQMILKDAMLLAGITPKCYYGRIKAGWTQERALSEKPIKGKKLSSRIEAQHEDQHKRDSSPS